jgi:hypothetical protein
MRSRVKTARQTIGIRNPLKTALGAALLGCGLFSCATIPEPNFKAYAFPEAHVFVDGQPTRKFKVLGPVRVRVNFDSMNPERDEQELCRNAFNKGAGDLLKRAKRELKADAVMDVRSVVYYMDGKTNSFSTPECADDGGEGQILMEAKAVRYIREKKKKKVSDEETEES